MEVSDVYALAKAISAARPDFGPRMVGRVRYGNVVNGPVPGERLINPFFKRSIFRWQKEVRVLWEGGDITDAQVIDCPAARRFIKIHPNPALQ